MKTGTFITEIERHGSFIEGRCVSINLGPEEDELGYFGELHPKVITNFDLNYPVTAFELFVDKIKK